MLLSHVHAIARCTLSRTIQTRPRPRCVSSALGGSERRCEEGCSVFRGLLAAGATARFAMRRGTSDVTSTKHPLGLGGLEGMPTLRLQGPSALRSSRCRIVCMQASNLEPSSHPAPLRLGSSHRHLCPPRRSIKTPSPTGLADGHAAQNPAPHPLLWRLAHLGLPQLRRRREPLRRRPGRPPRQRPARGRLPHHCRGQRPARRRRLPPALSAPPARAACVCIPPLASSWLTERPQSRLNLSTGSLCSAGQSSQALHPDRSRCRLLTPWPQATWPTWPRPMTSSTPSRRPGTWPSPRAPRSWP